MENIFKSEISHNHVYNTKIQDYCYKNNTFQQFDKVQKQKKRKEKKVSEKDFNIILQFTKTCSFKNKRDKLALVLLYITGLKISTLLYLTVKNLNDLLKDHHFILSVKNNKIINAAPSVADKQSLSASLSRQNQVSTKKKLLAAADKRSLSEPSFLETIHKANNETRFEITAKANDRTTYKVEKEFILIWVIKAHLKYFSNVKDCIETLIENKAEFDYVFTKKEVLNKPISRENFTKNLNNILQKAGKTFEKEKVFTTHSLRSTYITNLTKLTSLDKASQLIGHKNINSTLNYIYENLELTLEEKKKFLQKSIQT